MTDNEPRPRTPEAEQAFHRFMEVYTRNLKKGERISLNILVWGPSPTADSPAARKRIEIRDNLQSIGHNAMFSEDIPDVANTLSQKSKEFAQAQSADLVAILLEDAPGALAEAHDFCNHPDIAPKIFILVPEHYRAGYSALGAISDLQDAYGGVHWYAPSDLVACHVYGAILRRTEALRQLRLRHK